MFFPKRRTFIACTGLALVACSQAAPANKDDGTGGVATGGVSGATTGGVATGGTSGSSGAPGGALPTGGVATGGVSGTGGVATGGVSGTGGVATGGVGGVSGGAGPAGAAGTVSGGSAGTSAGTGGSAGTPMGGAGGKGGTGGAGAGGAGGKGGTGGGATTCSGTLSGFGGTPSRPNLTGTQAACHTILSYLAKTGTVTAPTTDNWNPTAGVGDVSGFTPTYTVAATGGAGTHTTVQAAITAAVNAGGTNRIFIRVVAGTYREVVCVPTSAPPITLYSTSTDASQTTIVYNHLAGTTVDSVVNTCSTPSGTTYGTSGSATFAAFGAGFMAKNLTISNDGDEASVSSATQGVALSTRNDKLVFENVRLLGNQDTLLVGTNNVANIMRAYFKGATIEGDVDFICGRGTAVFDGGTIRLATNRRPNGNLLAPSTDSRNAYGFLVIGATLTAASGATGGGMTLGRAWDESQVDVATYTTNVGTGIYPNGQAVVRDSMLGAHVNGTAPWASAATTSRPYSSTPTATLPANRLWEYNDTGP